MIDLKQLRDNPDHFRHAARSKHIDVDIDQLVQLDRQRRELLTQQESKRAEQNRIGKKVGPQIGKLKGQLKKSQPDQRDQLEQQIRELEQKPAALKAEIQDLDAQIAAIEPPWRGLWLKAPQPPAANVPNGRSEDDNVEIRQWNPQSFNPAKSFADNKGFEPKTHLELIESLGLVDFERAVKMAGTRHYVLTGAGMKLHQAVLRWAFDYMTNENGFTPVSVPVIVREECMVGTGFFPSGREQAYHIEESKRGAGHDLYLTGTGEVGLMGLHQDEIVEKESLPFRYTTVSTCFRREAGAAGRETAGLYRIHQFEKVEQVVICKADEEVSQMWHRTMLGFVENLLQQLELPYRLVQCCTGDLGLKNADMIDIECWMPGRGEEDSAGRPTGGYGETHSASRLNDFQCRRLNLRYRDEDGSTTFCYSLNNTVIASPRILIPILEIHQNEDGSVTVPKVLRPYMGDVEKIENE